jgi:hypothetical protein
VNLDSSFVVFNEAEFPELIYEKLHPRLRLPVVAFGKHLFSLGFLSMLSEQETSHSQQDHLESGSSVISNISQIFWLHEEGSVRTDPTPPMGSECQAAVKKTLPAHSQHRAVRGGNDLMRSRPRDTGSD